MKRFLLSLTSLLLVVSLFGQSNARTGFLKDDYLKKQKPEEGSKDTSGRWRCSYSNGVSNTTRGIGGLWRLSPAYMWKNKKDDVKAAFGLTGVVSMLASVPFFIASGKNKKRGNSVSGYLKMQKTPLLVKNDKNSYPAIHLKITF